MRKCIVFAVVLIATAGAAVAAPQGMTTRKSPFDVFETLDRLERILEGKGFTIVARINHAEGAVALGETLRATQLLLFSDRQSEITLLRSDQAIGIDLPLKALAWEDQNGRVFLAYNQPSYMVSRYRLTNRPVVVRRLTQALDEATREAVTP